MVREVVIKVDSSKDLNQIGEHILVRNGNVYQPMSREQFFAPYIAEFEKMKSLLEEYHGANQEFKKEINNQMNSFLTQYKETNAKVIEMVKSVINSQGD